jgi:hypothetical protein
MSWTAPTACDESDHGGSASTRTRRRGPSFGGDDPSLGAGTRAARDCTRDDRRRGNAARGNPSSRREDHAESCHAHCVRARCAHEASSYRWGPTWEPSARPSRPPIDVRTYDSSSDLTRKDVCEASAGPGSSPRGRKSLLYLCWIDGNRRLSQAVLQGPPFASKIAFCTYDLNENDTTCSYMLCHGPFEVSPEQQIDVGRRRHFDSGPRGCVCRPMPRANAAKGAGSLARGGPVRLWRATAWLPNETRRRRSKVELPHVESGAVQCSRQTCSKRLVSMWRGEGSAAAIKGNGVVGDRGATSAWRRERLRRKHTRTRHSTRFVKYHAKVTLHMVPNLRTVLLLQFM